MRERRRSSAWPRSHVLPPRRRSVNGARQRTPSTTVRDLDPHPEAARQATLSRRLLELRRQVDQMLFAVVIGAYPHGVSSGRSRPRQVPWRGNGELEVRGVPDLRRLDTEVAVFRDRASRMSSIRTNFLAATSCKARVNHRDVSQGGGRRERGRSGRATCSASTSATVSLRSLHTPGCVGVT